ncbi:MAG: TatD family hydrolase [Clostridia bacterium]|jgi:hydrolase, tatD family
MEFFDSHSHYNDEKFDEDREQILEEIYKAGVTKVIVAGYDINSSKKAVDLSKKYKYIYAICGISPNDIAETENEIKQQIEQIEKIAQSTKIVGIGEIGLDYYWNKENKELQKKAFINQIKLADKMDLPIIIHTREAVMDTIQILKENTPKRKGVFHCCPLNIELVKEGLKLGFYISLAGPITFKNSKNADEIIQMIPLEKMLIETDSPYLAPEPNRGTRNDSRNLKYLVEKIAQVKQREPEEIAKIIYNNWKL